MAEAIRMPRMSDTMTEGVIVEWHKKEGDKVKPGDVLADVETDKATMELESYQEGTILYVAAKKGQSVPVEGLLAVVGKEGEDYKKIVEESKNQPKKNPEKNAESLPKKDENEEKAIAEGEEKQSDNTPADVTLPKGAKEIRMPLLSDTMKEGKILKWNKKVGDKVTADDALAEVETDKATMDVVGYEEGTLLYIGVEAGQAAKINELIDSTTYSQRFIAHCLEEDKKDLNDISSNSSESKIILIGPEGDFSEEEVAKAIEHGFTPISLGESRLRTETAALVACHTVHVVNQIT